MPPSLALPARPQPARALWHARYAHTALLCTACSKRRVLSSIGFTGGGSALGGTERYLAVGRYGVRAPCGELCPPGVVFCAGAREEDACPAGRAALEDALEELLARLAPVLFPRHFKKGAD